MGFKPELAMRYTKTYAKTTWNQEELLGGAQP